MTLNPITLVKQGWGLLHHHSRHHVRQRPYILPIFGLVLGAAIVMIVVAASGGNTFTESRSHVVFLFDKGKRQTINTQAATVGELIDKLPLRLIPEDVVEPARQTPIVVDNFRINVYRARPVTIVDTASRTVTLTAQRSARVVAETAGLEVFPEDEVDFAPGDINRNILGEQVAIDRATPVALNLYGTPLTVRTRTKTVAELLQDRNVQLAEGDTVQPDVSTSVTPNLQVFVVRKGVQIATVEEVVPAPTKHVQDANLTFGTTAVRQKGASGKRVVTYQIQITNGRQTGRTKIQEIVTVQPVPRIVAVGAASLSLSLQEWLLKLRNCETGGNYQTNTGNGYYGAYQFAAGTWNSLNTGYARADLAPPSVQDQAVIANTLRASGGLASQHPGCYKKLGLSKFPPSNR